MNRSERPTRPGHELAASVPARLLDRILGMPQLARAVPRLPAEILHRIVQHCGLEDCGDLVALATPEQLTRVLDLDVWTASRPGMDERFDANRFGVWLEVLFDAGAGVAADKLAGMDADLVAMGIARHARVFDRGSVSPFITLDGELVTPERGIDDEQWVDVGGYVMVALRHESWDAIVATLMALADAHPVQFEQVMRGCVDQSSSLPELDISHDLLSDRDQALFDVAVDRDERRERQGYASPAQARAFLDVSRRIRLDSPAMPSSDPMVAAYFRALALDFPPPVDTADAASSEESAPAVAAVVDVLIDAGILPQQPKALLSAAPDSDSRLALIDAHMQTVLDRDETVYSLRMRELAYLANTLAAGCTIQSRPFTAAEATNAAIAICNLGLENWPRAWSTDRGLPDDFLATHDLVRVFQAGWAVLYQQVSMEVSRQLLDILSAVRTPDEHIQDGLDELRLALIKHERAGTPWRAREALDVIESLDMPAWAALSALVDECPAMHAAMNAAGGHPRAFGADAYEFISRNRDIAAVRAFMAALPERLR